MVISFEYRWARLTHTHLITCRFHDKHLFYFSSSDSQTMLCGRYYCYHRSVGKKTDTRSGHFPWWSEAGPLLSTSRRGQACEVRRLLGEGGDRTPDRHQ